MRMYVTVKTENSAILTGVDVLELKLSNGAIVTLDWDSTFGSEKPWGAELEMRGVSYRNADGEDEYEYANGKLAMFEGAELSAVEIHSATEDSCAKDAFVITGICFEDEGNTYSLPEDVIAAFYAVDDGDKTSLLTAETGRLTFRDRLVSGLCNMDALEDEVEKWHNAPEDNTLLRTHLGFSEAEYNLLLRDSNALEQQLMSARTGS